MITEDYVSFETAKLLKKKGFNWNTDKQFNLDKIVGDYDITDRSRYPERYLDAPTLQMAMKWLRDVHHLVIQIEFIDFLEHGEVWLYSIIERKTIKQLTGRDEDFTEHSYEEACEAAIKYCLEKLI